MGQNVPNTLTDLIQWGESHEPLWTANALSVGITVPQALAFKNAVLAARAAFNAAEAARLASKNATHTLATAARTLRVDAGEFTNTIKAFAQTTNNPNVYVLAGVSAPDPRGTIAPPAQPEKISASLNTDGSLTLRWKATQPAGSSHTVYLIFRKLEGESSFALIDTVGAKVFEDDTLPRGVDGVTYMIQSKRGSETGPPSDQIAVTFGTVAGGGGIAAMTSAPGAAAGLEGTEREAA